MHIILLHAVKNKIQTSAKQKWYYKYLPDKVAKGFTLAEVLLALLVIGIVASLVIPAAITDFQNAEFKTTYKKAFSAASIATKQAFANGLFVSRRNVYDQEPTLYNFNVFKNQFSVAKECMNNNNNKCWNPSGEHACTNACSPTYPQGVPTVTSRAFIDNSGMAWSLYTNSEDIILVDTNGDKAPNRFGKDRWMFVFKTQQNQRITVGLPYKIAPYYNRDQMYPDNMACHYPPCNFISWLTQ